MPTQRPIIGLAVDKELIKKIEAYQKKHKLYSKSEAVRQLIRKALQQEENSNPTDRKR